MNYRITHTTTYHYSQAVGLCQNQARLQPRNLAHQRCLNTRFVITPTPSDFQEFDDYFGNRTAYFAIQQAHKELTVTAISDVCVTAMPMPSNAAITWEAARELLSSDSHALLTPELLEAKQFLLDSAMVTASDDLVAYAEASFTKDQSLFQATCDLTQRIYHDFTYDPSFTTIATPLATVLEHKRGVCQDFAHLAIACLRSLGLAARYISGYLETIPAPGTPRLVGADASHAWFAVYIPTIGWQDFDPTNNKIPNDQYITLGWGRDFADVTPLKGIAYGGGHHSLSVSVDVARR